MGLEKDSGYAWIVAAASAFLMFMGPCTFTSYGLLFSSVPLSPGTHLEILNFMYVIWLVTGLFAGPLANNFTHRKIAMTGCFMAICGLLLTSTTLRSPAWFFLTFSVLVGGGLGLAINTTCLLVTCHFEKYRGLANGIGLVSMSLGNIVTPLLYGTMESPKDKIHIRALITAIAFLGATFYMAPREQDDDDDEDMSTRCSSRKSHVSMKKHDQADEIKRANDALEGIPLVCMGLPEMETEDFLVPTRLRRRSLYLYTITTTMLPNIPEESEVSSQLDTTTSESVDEDSEATNRTNSFEDGSSTQTSSEFADSPSRSLNSNMTLDNDSSATNSTSSESEVLLSSPNLNELKDYVTTTSINNVELNHKMNSFALSVDTSDRTNDTTLNSLNTLGTNSNQNSGSVESVQTKEKSASTTSANCDMESVTRSQVWFSWREAFCSKEVFFKTWTNLNSVILWHYCKDIHFLNVAIGCALTIVALPNFPLVMYSYLKVLQSEISGNASETEIHLDNELDNGHPNRPEMCLLIIFFLDLAARLLVSYISDFSFVNRRVGFLIATLLSTFIIAGIGYVTNIHVIYWMCAIYGACLGVVTATETLLFVDLFGIENLPSTFAIYNAMKVTVFIFMTLLTYSPIAFFVYTIYPFTKYAHQNWITEREIDPLGLFVEEEYEKAVNSRQNMLCIIAAPGMLCVVAWLVEFILVKAKTEKSTSGEHRMRSVSIVPPDIGRMTPPIL